MQLFFPAIRMCPFGILNKRKFSWTEQYFAKALQLHKFTTVDSKTQYEHLIST